MEMWDEAVLPAFADALETLGFDTMWLSDIPMGSQVDPIVGLAFAASRTTRLKLGANIVPIGRNPMLLAKELAQLDQLSNGRVLISLVPGLEQPMERQALGIGAANRGALLDEVIPLLRQWWAGETVDHRSERFHFPGVQVRPLPVQQPLEIWLGGVGPAALRRAGRFSDGWLGAMVTPEEAGDAVRTITQAALEADRSIDPEHFGLSIGYSRHEPDQRVMAGMQARRPDADIAQLLPIGDQQLREQLRQLVDNGVSKFVARPIVSGADWHDDLKWLADTVLPMQT
jgi:probable F420-dependent oxidoreductase